MLEPGASYWTFSWMSVTAMDPVQEGCCGLLLEPLATEHYCYRLHPPPTWSSSIARSPALVGLLFSYCFPATKSTLDGLFSWLQSFWYTFPSSYPRRVFALQFPRPQVWTGYCAYLASPFSSHLSAGLTINIQTNTQGSKPVISI